MKLSLHKKRIRRARRVRARIQGTASRPRVSVFRSLKHISVQAIDDVNRVTIAAATDKGLTGKPVEKAATIGANLAAKLKEAGITEAVFDRGSFKYHGRVAAVAEAIREAGIKL